MSNDQSKYDEMRAMAEAVAQMGDEFPMPTEGSQIEPVTPTAAAEAVAVPVADPTADASAHDDEDFVRDGQIDLDAILGIEPKKAPEPQPKAEATEPAAPKPAPEHEPTPMEKRLSEMAAEIRSLRESNDALTRRALADDKPQQQQAATDDDDGELSPDVVAYLKKYGVVTREDLSTIQKAVDPLLQQQEDQQIAAFVANHVDGFKAEHMPALYDAINAMSEQERAWYAGVQGAALLAASLVKRGALDLGTKSKTEPAPRTPNPALARHHTEAAGSRPPQSEAEQQLEWARKIAEMPDDQFLAQLQRLQN